MGLFSPMSWFNKPVYNIYQLQETKQENSVNEKLDKEGIERIRESLKDYATAITNAEDTEQYDQQRYELLLNLYANIELDETVSTVTDTIQNRVLQTPFKLLDKNRNEDEKTAYLFKNIWFYDFVAMCLKSEYWPFTLILLGNKNEKGFESVECVDRWYIRPSILGVSKYKWQNNTDFDFKKEPLKSYSIFLTPQKHLGLYSIIAKKFILKREILQYWAVFNELYTTPYFWVKTQLNDSKHRNNLLNALKSRKHSGFQIVGMDDEINSISNGGQGWQSYEKFEENANTAILRAFLGSSMVVESGSSLSQSEVHERQLETFINSKMQRLEFIINGRLIPLMVNLGMINKDVVFKWDLSKTLNLTQLVDAVAKLSPNFDFDENEISEKIGLTLIKKKNVIQPQTNSNNNR